MDINKTNFNNHSLVINKLIVSVLSIPFLSNKLDIIFSLPFSVLRFRNTHIKDMLVLRKFFVGENSFTLKLHVNKFGFVVFEKKDKILTFDANRKPTNIFHLSDSGDLKINCLSHPFSHFKSIPTSI